MAGKMTSSRPNRVRRPSMNTSALVLILLLVTILMVYGRQDRSGLVQWGTDYRHGLAESSVSGKPLLLNFTINGCSPCRHMENEVFSREHVATTIHDAFVPVRLNMSYQGATTDAVAQTYRVLGYPTMIIAHGDGKALSRREGFMNESQLMAWLNAARAERHGHETVPSEAATTP